MRKAGPPPEIPPPLELECLKVLWRLGEGNVQQVQQALAPARSLAYTTVMTVLERLARKGAVARRKVSRSFVYTPVLSQDSLRRLAVQQLVNSFFSGSPEELRAYLEGSEPGSGKAPAGEPEAALDTELL